MAEKTDDLSLPNAVVSRIINEALPPNTNVSADSRKAIAKAASVFVIYATATAAGAASKAGRKTVNAGDVLEAIEELNFEQFLDPMKKSLEHFREQQKIKKQAAASKPKKSAGNSEEQQPSTSPTGKARSTSGSPPNKKSANSTPVKVVNIASSSESESDD